MKRQKRAIPKMCIRDRYKNAFTYNNYGYSNAMGSFLIVASFLASVLLTGLFAKANKDD